MLKQQAAQRDAICTEGVGFWGRGISSAKKIFADLSMIDAILKYFNEYSRCVHKTLLKDLRPAWR